ncbi:MAG: FliA/WhiG family RNA polymerase sigma factor [Lachnospiraceae bacterium]|nr:FliA/WhiG family RNA polymerase sigma factor [Lachnospiraceae bacterium]
MDDSRRQKLWSDYTANPTQEQREKIILEYAPLVKVVAGRLAMYLGYNVEYEDLVSYGIFGLIDAIDKFDSTKDVKFETYASLRIRGSILDQIRKMDWIPRTVRKRQRDIQTAIKEIEGKTGKTASDEEIAEYLGISGEEYDNWQSQMKVTNLVSLDEFIEQGGGDVNIIEDQGMTSKYDLPEEAVEKEELKKILAEALLTLTEKERRVIELYYYEELTLKEISNILEVSESRVSQLHTKALGKMKGKMGSYMGMIAGNM